MSHETLDQNRATKGWNALSGVIDGLVKTIKPLAAFVLNSPKVRQCQMGMCRKRQACRIWSDDQILCQPALQSQVRHAERLVLVVQLAVSGTVSGFGNAPGNAVFSPVLHLRFD